MADGVHTAGGPEPVSPEGGTLILDRGDGRTLAVSRVPDRVTGSAPAAGEFDVEELRHNKKNDATAGIWRIRGTRGSAVLKVFRPPAGRPRGFWPTSEDPAHWNHWRREFLAYSTGLAGTAYAECGIAAPAVLSAVERQDGLLELWLEDVPGPDGFGAPATHLARFAYELGAGQARWAGAVPDLPWLSRGWLAQYLAEGPSRSVACRDEDWDHPCAAVWPRAVRERLRRLWHQRARAAATATAGPATLCHLDVWPANLLRGPGGSVLLDWSFVGEGALGEDVANLVLDSFTDGLMDAGLLPEVAETCVEGYLQGLRDAGLRAPADGIRKAVAACGAAKYSWFAPAVLGRAVADERVPSSYNSDGSPVETLRRVTDLVTAIADWADRADS